LGFGALALAGSAASAPLGLMLLPVATFLIVLTARIPFCLFARTLRVPFVFLLVMTPLLAVSGAGPGIRVGFLYLSQNGLVTAGEILVRALSIMGLVTALFYCTRLQTVIAGLVKIGLPAPLAAVLMFTYRYIGLYSEDLRRMRTAARLRGLEKRSRGQLKATAGMLLTLLVRSYAQSERVFMAMRLRGYRGGLVPTQVFRTRARDPLLTALFVCAAAAIALLEVV
jgi:cobalt/nickel transport system permease protein